MTRRGLVGGTFDPIHTGHLDLARVAADALALDEVVVLPSRLPPHRAAPQASAAHRFAMAALAIQHEPRWRLSDVELETDGPSFTTETLGRLAALGWMADDLFFIAGADAFRDIPLWRDYPAVVDRCHFIVVSRPGIPASSLPATLPDLAGRMRSDRMVVPGRRGIFLVEAATAAVSSTDVRQRLAAGRPVDNLLPRAVADYIQRQGLYGPDAKGDS